MVATVGRVSAGDGYEYLTREVATGAHDYYLGNGEAAGVWHGSGASRLGLSGEVAEEEMAALYGRFVDPRTAGGLRAADGRIIEEVVLGRKSGVYKTLRDGTRPKAVAAFDVTFSPSKSVSVLWAVATDLRVRADVQAAHDRAVDVALEYLERHAGHSRAGRAGARHVAAEGFIIAKFRHRTNRNGDPQLHTHCAVLNRIYAEDRWRTLDSRAIYRNAHAAGAIYAAELEAELSNVSGVEWTAGTGAPMRELSAVPDALAKRWSSRRQEIIDRYRDAIADFYSRLDRHPTRSERSSILQAITLETRRPKQHRGDRDLHAMWRGALSANEQLAVDRAVRPDRGPLDDGDRVDPTSPDFASRIFAALHESRAVWTRANVVTEIARLASDARLDQVESLADQWLQHPNAVLLTPPDQGGGYDNPGANLWSSTTILAAEAFLVDAANRRATWSIAAGSQGSLGDDQWLAAQAMTGGEWQLTTIVGPAGSGKTTMLRDVATAYRAAGRGVTVLTLSAAAARVVTDETGVNAATIKTWKVGGVNLPKGGLLLIDEAAMVPTLMLADLVRTAQAQGSRVALVGDPAQMNSPQAGGIVAQLSREPSAVDLVLVRRFREIWERTASLLLREMDPGATDVYDIHDRIRPVTAQDADLEAVDAWWADTESGVASLLVVATSEDAARLSSLCQAQLAAARRIGERALITAADGNAIHVGDVVVTRLNDRAIVASDKLRVLNRDSWSVLGLTTAGKLLLEHCNRAATIELPADYVTTNVQLAYATTVAGAQGRTVDRGHTIVTPSTGSQALYVAMTRGRQANVAHVVVDGHDLNEWETGTMTAREAFDASLRRDTRERSATETRRNWVQATGERGRIRRDDQAHMAASVLWQRLQARLPAIADGVLRHRHIAIIHALAERCDVDREDLVERVSANVDWSRTHAGRDFVRHLRTASAQPAPVRRTVRTPRAQEPRRSFRLLPGSQSV